MSLLQVKKFNHTLRETIEFLNTEYPKQPEIKDLTKKANLALAANGRVLLEGFQTYVKLVYGEKICNSDESFVDDVQHHHADQVLMPAIVKLWGQIGAKTKDPELLKAKIMTRLQTLCDLC